MTLTLNPVSRTRYRECVGVIRVVYGANLPNEGLGDIIMSFQTENGEIDSQLHNVALAPTLSHNLFSLSSSYAVTVIHTSAMVTG